MVLEVGVFAETARADVTLERPRAAVHVHVRFQISRRRERLGTQGALVRLLLFTRKKKKKERKAISQSSRFYMIFTFTTPFSSFLLLLSLSHIQQLGRGEEGNTPSHNRSKGSWSVFIPSRIAFRSFGKKRSLGYKRSHLIV